MTKSKDIKELKQQRDKLKNTKTEVYSRIVGYYRPISNWNIGKAQEFTERVTFDTPNMDTPTEVMTTDALFLFWKNSCPNCAMPKAWAAANPGLVTVINLDENPEYIDKYNLMATPTLILDLGKKITRICGVSEIMKTMEDLKQA